MFAENDIDFDVVAQLSEQDLKELGLSHAVVAEAIGAQLENIEGIAAAIPTPVVGSDESRPRATAIVHNHHPERSGDIYVYQQPYWFLFDRGAIGSMHGSPWNYDSHVPLVFAGPGIKSQRIRRPVHLIDVAPTLAALLGLHAPAGAEGEPLIEATAD